FFYQEKNLFLSGFHRKICYQSQLNQKLILFFFRQKFLSWHYSLTSYAKPATLKLHFLQAQIPTASLPNLSEPHCGHFLCAFNCRCTDVNFFLGLRPYF